MRRLLYFVLLHVGCLLWGVSHAQDRKISGVVTSDADNTPLVGATVSVKGTNMSTTTNNSGGFTITAGPGQSLVVSYIGFTSQEIPVGSRSTINIRLKQGQNTMQDIVVVGYGTQRRANLTGAVSTVNVQEQIGSRPNTDVGRALQGAVPGLTIFTSSGDIGTNPSIRLRGLIGSLNSSATPLILVDNVEISDLRLVNPEDIESISVLKDAASTSIYGTRAAWGVILITTKSGKRGAERSSISYNNNFSFSQPTVIPKVAPAAEGAEMALVAYQRANAATSGFTALGMTVDPLGIQKMREWQQLYGSQNLGPEMVMGRDFEIRGGQLFFYRSWDPNEMYLRDWAPQQNHNLTFSGSNAKTGYTLGLGFLEQKGALKVNPDEFQRFNVNLGVTHAATNWLDVRTKVLLSRAKRTRPYYFSSDTYDPWYYLSRWQAFYPYGTYEGKPFRSALTEVQQAQMTPITDNFTRFQIGGTLKILKGLTFDADYTFSSTAGREHQTGGSVTAIDFWSSPTQLNYRPYTSTTYDRAILLSEWTERNTIKGFATYTKDIGNHNLKAIVGTDIELFQYGSQRSERRGLLNPDMGQPNLATGDQFVGSTAGHWSTLGYFGRINYAFKNKYLFEVNGRYDGSSAFPVNDRWAFFSSASAGYVITQEDFMDFAKPVLSFLKFRGSYGSVGNQNVGANRFISTMASSSSGWLIGSLNMQTVATPGPVSSSLTWEKVTTLDLGADARIFKNKVGITLDWYRRTTSGMITAGLTVPSTLGVGAPVRNFGDLQTTGWELAVDWNHQFSNGLNFNITGILSDFNTKLTNYASNATKLISSNYEGRTIGEIWGYETDRFFTEDDFEKDASGNFVVVGNKYVLKKGIPTQTRWENTPTAFFFGPGDIKYKDLNGDGKIDIGKNTVDDPGDQRVIGNTTPRYQYGIRLGVDFKGFDLNMFIQGVGSRQLWANGPVVIPGYRAGEGWFEHQLDYWTPANRDAFYPRPTNANGAADANSSKNFLPQTKYLLNMAYTRLKNINLGYTLSESIAKKIHLQKIRLYVSGENLLTLDNLSVPIDPEVDYTEAGLNDSNTFGRVYPYRKVLSFGLQVTL
ncbi:MAG: TonB-dependent receptor [Chitinophagaceae bacterium]|nr:MAG: TonB-dependent receptor [Chitinophagaceae bacterium]